MRLAVDPDLPLIAADAAQLERAFANLLENAVRHGGGRPVLGQARGWSVTRSRPRGRPGPGHPAERVAADLRAVPARRGRAAARGAPGSGWRSPRASSRPTAARSRSSRCPARARSFVVSLPARREPGRERAGAGPRLRRRAADPARAEGDPARGRLRGGRRRQRRGGARPAAVRPPATPRSST